MDSGGYKIRQTVTELKTPSLVLINIFDYTASCWASFYPRAWACQTNLFCFKTWFHSLTYRLVWNCGHICVHNKRSRTMWVVPSQQLKNLYDFFFHFTGKRVTERLLWSAQYLARLFRSFGKYCLQIWYDNLQFSMHDCVIWTIDLK